MVKCKLSIDKGGGGGGIFTMYEADLNLLKEGFDKLTVWSPRAVLMKESGFNYTPSSSSSSSLSHARKVVKLNLSRSELYGLIICIEKNLPSRKLDCRK